ncbi:MAG: tetratricopeptide repeat protein [Bacteroidales bacterium]
MSQADERELQLAQLEAAVAEFDARVAAEPEAAFPAHAEALLNLAGAQAEAGQLEDALASAERAVEQYRRLFVAQPADFAVSLASALNTLSNRLSELGRDDDGRAAGDEAFQLARKAVEVDPDQARFVLVSVLMNQSGRSWRAGQSLRAIEEMGTAVDEFRAGGAALYPYLGTVVDALHRNAMALAEAGRWDEAVMVRRMTAKAFPDGHVPPPVSHLLALTMQQGAFALSRAGRPGEGLPLVEEAVDIARGLAEAAPEQYRLFLAQSLANLASRQHESHADAEALEAALEAVNAFQEVAKVDAASAIVPLAATLETFASILATLGYTDQARNVLAQREQLQAAMRPVEQ